MATFHRFICSLSIAVALGVCATGSGGARAQEAEYDVVIRNGRVLDGTGSPWVRADVAIKDGRFVRVGRVEGRGRKEIDATGRYVTPGWIDMMDQSGRIFMREGAAPNKVLMGVTTAIGGEGGTPVSAREIGAYLDGLEQRGIAINFGTYYSATQARRAAMGDGAGRPTAPQMKLMKDLVAEAMRQGAFGISTALIYPPAVFQSTDELVELSRVANEYGGIYATHLRDESKGLLGGLGEAIEIGDRAGIRVEVFHLKAAYRPGWGELMPSAGELIEQARGRGVDIAADIYPYVAGATGLEVTVPTWVFAGGLQEARKRLADPEQRERMKRDLAAGPTADWTNLVDASGGWKHVILANSYSEKYKKFHFLDFEEIGKRLGRDPADVAWDILLEAQPHRPLAIFYMMSEGDVETGLKFPWTSIGSDAAAAEKLGSPDDLGLPHPRSYGTFPRVIAEYVRRRKVLTLAEAIRKMTAWPASRMGLNDRGVIREGLWADVVVFDFDRIEDRATWENPSETPTGIDYVLVNGQIVAENGNLTGVKPGKALRGPGASTPPKARVLQP